MERKNTKTLTTGEFASYVGVNKDTLFYYDKINLFKPAGKLLNGYRYYTYDQIKSFSTLQSLRKLGVSIEELKEYLSSQNKHKFVQMAKQQTVIVEKEIEKLLQIQRFFKQIISTEEELKDVKIRKVYIQKMEKKYIFLSNETANEGMNTVEEWSEQYKHFGKQIGLHVPVPIGSLLTKDTLIQERFERVDYLFSYSELETEHSRPEGLYAIYYHEGPYKNIESSYLYVTNFIKSEGYAIVGHAYEEYLYDSLKTNDEEEYLTKISIQVKQQSKEQ
ncbi:MerR family transcriptional regulator (plasmid) [Priestia aryabhattai]|uniref:MerR family transcriptional regulator n=1 Tax=Priestia TaxID=2800373 RepID=UPI0011B3EE5C|nr:MerR family transcriptional regulator [Priestia megaterium]MBD8114598.1 MerR family transcriptional regulator [Priestia megaterium]QDZ88046.1 MerR family transcriptional regulator [Priestia megaterium]